MIPLSVLDVATVVDGATPRDALADTTTMARAVETLGYHRFWVAEHHAMAAVASSAPAVLIAHLANATTTLRLGAGGVMLPNHAPLVVAEQFATLEALFPGRIDLGLGRAPGTDHVTARALRRAGDLHATTFPQDVVELINYLVPQESPPHPAPTPGAGYLPEVWLLGSSTFSAHLAGQLGLPFSFAYHFAPSLLDEAVEVYRSNFRGSPFLDSPYLMVAASVICADDDERARWLSGSSALNFLQRARGTLGPLPSPEAAASIEMTDAEAAYVDTSLATHFIGSPAHVHEGLAQLGARTTADEIMVSTRIYDLGERRRSFELLAQAWGLVPASTPTNREVHHVP